MNMATPIVTTRKMEALVAVLLGGSPYQRVIGPDNDPHLSFPGIVSNTGGSQHRMVDELKDMKLITRQSRDPDFEEPESNKLTAKGYKVIIEQAKGRFERILAPHVDRLEQEHTDREDWEYARNARYAQARARRRQAEEARKAARDAETVKKARQIMSEEALDVIDWNDERTLNFVDRIASL